VILVTVVTIVLGIGAFIYIPATGAQDEPDLNVTISRFLPQDKTTPHTNITVHFSRDMVPSDSLDRPVISPPLVFEPPLAGIARWIEQNILRFYPDHGLAPATEYKVRVRSDDIWLYGNRINDDREFKFHTPELSLTRMDYNPIYDPLTPGQVRLKLDIQFNYDVDLEELIKNTIIKGSTDAAQSRLQFDLTRSVSSEGGVATGDYHTKFAHEISLTTEPFPITDRKQSYLLKISSGLLCKDCGRGLAETYETAMSVSMRQRQYIRDIGARITGKATAIHIRCNTSINPDDAQDFISLSPAVDFTVEQRYGQLVLHGPFESRKTYTVIVAKGMPAQDGSLLEHEFSSMVTIPDIPPTIAFQSEGIYLPQDGSKLLELETINVSRLSLEVDQIFANNLVYALAANSRELRSPYMRNIGTLGRKFYSQTVDLNGGQNATLLSTIDVGRIIGDTARGIFKIAARNLEGRWNYDARLLMLTDIGITARLSDNHLMVWVNSLSETKPLKNARVRLFSKNNQELLYGQTNSRGIVLFDDISEALSNFQPYLITVEYKDDLSYLNLNESRIATSDFDTRGRPITEDGYEAFMYLDRGVYRPGDTVRIVSLVRKSDGSSPPEFPYFIIVNDPTGREFTSFRVSTGSEQSLTTLDIPIPDFARTGKYSLMARVGDDYEIGRIAFQIEEFMPDRMKVSVITDKEEYQAGDTVRADITGQFLFGPPASNHKVSGHLTIEPHEFRPQGWSQFRFADSELGFSRIEIDLPDSILDETGKFSYDYVIPGTYNPPSALKGLVSAGVSETGGRAVYNYDEIVIHTYPRYVGLRLDFEGYAKPGEPCGISLIGVNRSSRPISIDNVAVKMYRVVYNSVLQRNSNGHYSYKSEKTLYLMDSISVDISSKGATASFIPPEYGKYLLVAHDPDGNHATSRSFYAYGWGYAPWSMENPDRIEIDLDREKYSPGDRAHLQIQAPFGGVLLLTIERDKVYEFIRMEMDENTAEIKIPIKREYFPNAYITATVIKKAAEVDKASPARAFGMIPLILSTEHRQLPITISAPEVIKPRTRVNVGISVGKTGVTHLTLAAVDAGILQLTDYQTPDPVDFYYGKKQPRLMPYDIYSLIYPEVERAESHLSPAGGRAKFDQARKRHVSPVIARRVKPVALWSGLVTTDREGNANVQIDVPEFNGKLILTAVAVQGDLFGAATGEIVVRDNIVIQESFPRFVAPNDIVDGLVTLFNNTGAQAIITVKATADGPLDFISATEQTVTIPNGSEGKTIFRFKAGLKPGKLSFNIAASDGSERAEINFELPNRPGQPLLSKFGFGSVTEDEPDTFDIPGDWLSGTTQTVIQTSSLAAVTCTKQINYLVRYPYGCLEQTTSGLFPLLYFNDLARFVEPEVFGTRGPDYFIREGIIKLTGMAQQDGWFSFWPETRHVRPWASIYASHFLLEAKRVGFHVDSDLYKNIVKNLKNIARGKNRDSKQIGHPEQIYAAYALTRAGIIENRFVNEIRSIPDDALPAYARYMLAGILHAAGDRESAITLLPETIVPAIFEPETGGRFSSGIRTNAILLSVLTDIQPDHAGCPVLVKSLMDKARTNRWYTTQATAWTLMSLGKYLAGQEIPDYTGTLELIGDTIYSFDTATFKVMRPDISDRQARLEISGPGTCYYYWHINGVPLSHAPEEFSRGIKIKRIYQTADGHPLDLKSVPLGSQIICHIEVEAVDNNLKNVVVNDLLPGALEIENPRLKTTPRLSWIPELKDDITFQDIRDDRLLLFIDLHPGKPVHFYYSLRVTSAGEFAIPPVAAECMYKPVVAGASSSGVMVVPGDK
jgi:uncharacterized protein YfaS (alpha-2-macroglobulin family)